MMGIGEKSGTLVDGTDSRLADRHHFGIVIGFARNPQSLYTGFVPKLLEEIYRLQTELTALDADEQRLLKMCANLLEGHYEVREPRNRLTGEEYEKMPGRWELSDGMLQDY